MTLWTVARQAPLSMEFSRQEYWSGLPFPSPGDLPHPGIKLGSPELQADSLLSEPPGEPLGLGGDFYYVTQSHSPDLEDFSPGYPGWHSENVLPCCFFFSIKSKQDVNHSL